MKKSMFSGILAVGLLPLLLSPTSAHAAGFITKTVSCPKSGFSVIPPGNRLELEDVIISTDGVTDVSLRWNPGVKILKLFMAANSTFVTNFQGQVESEDEQALKLDCGGNASLSITVVGTETF